MLVSAMYAGLFVTYNEGGFSRRERPPCTRLAFRSICIWLLIILSSLCISGPFFWTRLNTRFLRLRIRRVVRLIISIEQAITLLRGIFVSFSLWYEVYQRSGKGFPSLARECWLGKSWKKSILAFQHQYPERDESFRPELKECLQSVDILEKAIVLWCCTKFGMRLGKRCLLMKDGHNRQFASLCQESYCGGVCRSTLAKRDPQRLECSTAESGVRGERFYWDNRFIMAAMSGDDDLPGPLTSSLRLFIGIYLAQNIMT